MDETENDVLSYMTFPADHRDKLLQSGLGAFGTL